MTADLALLAANNMAAASPTELLDMDARRMTRRAVLAAAAFQRRSERRQLWTAVAMATALGSMMVVGSRLLITSRPQAAAALASPSSNIVEAPANIATVATAPVPPASPTVTPAAVPVPPPERATAPKASTRVPQTLAAGRAALEAGRTQLARRAAALGLQRQASAAPESRAPWYLLMADAEQRAGHPAAAAHALESVAAYRNGRAARNAAYRAAIIHFEQLDDPARALHALRGGGVVGPEQFVDQRSAELRVRVLIALDRQWEAQAVARFYLRKFRGTTSERYLRQVASQPAI